MISKNSNKRKKHIGFWEYENGHRHLSKPARIFTIIIVIALIVTMLILPISSYISRDVSSAYATSQEGKNSGTSKDSSGSKSSKKTVKAPTITAKSAIIYCGSTGEIIYEKNAETKFGPYSIIKLVTCLLAIQNLDMNQEVTVSEAAAKQGGSTMNLKAGEKVTVEQLIYGALVLSGNDAAYALAETVSGGDVKAFVEKMNAMADNLDCDDTHFSNPSGLKSSGNYTTAEDYIKILKTVMGNSTLKKMAGTTTYKMAKTNKSDAREMKTHVDLLTDKNTGVVAGKTGYDNPSDCSIAIEYNKNGLQLFIVLLGASENKREDDLKNLIAYAEKKCEGVKVVSAKEQVGKVKVRHGAKTNIKVYASTDGYAYLPKEGSKDLIDTKLNIKSGLKAPLKSGDSVGTYDIYVGDSLVNSIPIVIQEDVVTGWFPSYLWISNRMTIIICAVIILIIIIVASAKHRRKVIMRRKAEARQRKIYEIARRQMEEEEERRRRGWRF